ncbi:eukaryotic translation initiation factor 3 subunit D [Nadsonia fulvescens var. elongata DSM 6958]|uniref:Eukaryotic translation initiation factor 3 subunit D n=1 Tax=Nadsonia fulvescens var. elongata DSM 6958 TaxID=857566 RepID=A0A1E3PMK3_9ASCO|nr:eukaryotic translation initiation factor 3 subunit D [Nadsonia fulvescens var. elongata DSM 6958]
MFGEFSLPPLPSANSFWGPSSTVPTDLSFNDVPYAPFSKGDKLGKVADFTSDVKDAKDQKRQQFGRGARDFYHAYGASAASSFTAEASNAETAAFEVVDNTKAASAPRQQAVLKTRGGSSNARGAPRAFANAPSARGGFNRFNKPGARRFGRDFDKPQKTREASVNVTDEWTLLQTIEMKELNKLNFGVAPGETIGEYGYVNHYDRSLDRANYSEKLKVIDREVYNVTTSEDPIIQKLSEQDAGSVFATDSIIALLMCAPKSVNPWDIVITKKDGKIFFDKRDGGALDFISVDENAQEPPVDSTDKDNINSASSLAMEATFINQNFQANALVESQKVEFPNPNPYYSEEESTPLLAKGYSYKTFNLADDVETDEPINLVIRTEVDAVQPSTTGNNFMTLRALNEYGGINGNLEWKNKFNMQRGAIIAAEIKNNLHKLSRWTIQSMLAGASTMKLGFVTRATPKNNRNHIIVGVLGRDPNQFASQINVNINSGWGIIKSIYNIVNSGENGKYVLMKDPNNAQVMLYKVPESTFDADEQ